MVSPTLLREVNTLLDRFKDRPLNEQILDVDLFRREPCTTVKSMYDPLMTQRVFNIITGAYGLAYPYDEHVLPHIQRGAYRLAQDPRNPQNLTIAKQDSSCLDEKVSLIFLNTLKQFSLIYLNYLYQGWEMIPKEAYDKQKVPPSIREYDFIIKKNEHPFVIDHSARAFILSAQRDQSPLQVNAQILGWGQLGCCQVVHLCGSSSDIIDKLFQDIGKEVNAGVLELEISIPSSIVFERESIGKAVLASFLRKKQQEILDKSSQFLEIKPRCERSLPQFRKDS